jgi:hypothetical protein
MNSLRKICFQNFNKIENIDKIFDPSKIIELSIEKIIDSE